jgi:glyoxylase-like metal-dependent hydrolase (beta-lactamase superfamily II)
MTLWICEACGLEHPDSPQPPDECVICLDERQYVPPSGQAWTNSLTLQNHGTTAGLAEAEPGLHRMTVTPTVGIGHHSFLVETSAGNLLWEPPGFISEQAVALVQEKGGLAAISGSHPHLMGAMVSWSHAFDNAPVYVAEADRAWTRRPDPVITHWSGSESPLPGVTLVQCGGHFPGSSVLLWAEGADRRGVLLTGDTLFIGPGNDTLSVMRSYPNKLPLPEAAVRKILDRLHPLAYDRMYGSFEHLVDRDSRAVVERSLERYITWLRGEVHDY